MKHLNSNTSHIATRKRHITSSILLVSSLAFFSDASAVDGCKPDIHVTNTHTVAIKVLKMEYKDAYNKEFKEGLKNKKLAPGEKEVWKNQRLEGVAEGNEITKMRFKFKMDKTGTGSGPWGSAVWSLWHNKSGDCFDYINYETGI